LDETYLWAAIRYVERNPVRAKRVARAEDYAWSSAAAHCGLGKDPVLTGKKSWAKRLGAIADWSSWLATEEDAVKIEVLRRHVDKGLPCGSVRFVRRLGRKVGRVLEFRPQGRPKGASGEGNG